MAEVAIDGTTPVTIREAASMFERMESGAEPDHADADESQTEEVEEGQPEQTEIDEESEVAEPEAEAEESDDEEVEPDAAAEAPRTIKLQDGSEITEEEASKGYLRQSDYTKKTTAVAEAKKAFEAEQESVRGERQQLATQLTQLTEALKSFAPTEPDWDTIRKETPEEFGSQWAAWDQHTKQMARVEAARKKAVEDVARDQVQHLKAHMEAEQVKLLDAIPSWKDEKVAEKERKDLYDFALKSGYTADDLSSVSDHRVMVLLRKALLYDKGQAAKPAVRAKIEAVKAATPGSGNARRAVVTERVKARQQLAKTGSIRDAAALFEQMDDSK